MEKTGKQEKPATVDVITLEVTPQEGEKLALSATEGKLQLALRNYTDTAEVATKGTTVPVLLGSYFSPKEARAAEAKRSVGSAVPLQPRRPASVELIQGSKVTVVKLDKGE